MRPITLKKFGIGGYVDGLYIEPLPLETTINASVQPVPSSQYRFIPEGDSPANFRSIYTNEILDTGVNGGNKPDEIVDKGITYRLFQITDWNDNGYMHAIFKSTEVN